MGQIMIIALIAILLHIEKLFNQELAYVRINILIMLLLLLIMPHNLVIFNFKLNFLIKLVIYAI